MTKQRRRFQSRSKHGATPSPAMSRIRRSKTVVRNCAPRRKSLNTTEIPGWLAITNTSSRRLHSRSASCWPRHRSSPELQRWVGCPVYWACLASASWRSAYGRRTPCIWPDIEITSRGTIVGPAQSYKPSECAPRAFRLEHPGDLPNTCADGLGLREGPVARPDDPDVHPQEPRDLQ